MSYDIELSEETTYLHFFAVFDDCFVADSLTNKVLKLNDSLYEQLKNKSDMYSIFILKKKLRESSCLLNNSISNKSIPTPTITVFITHECNLKCNYCYDRFSCLHGYCNVDVVCRKIEETAEDGKINVHFFGGEPLLGFDKIQEIVDNCSRMQDKGILRDVRYSITTNAVLMDNNIISYFNENDFYVIVSADGLIEKRTLFGSNNKALTLDDICRIKQLDHYIIRCTVSPDWISDLSALMLKFYENGIANVAFSPALDSEVIYKQEEQKAWTRELMLIAEAILNGKLPSDFCCNLNTIVYKYMKQTYDACNETNSCNVHAIDLDGKEYRCHRMVAEGTKYSSDYYVEPTSVYNCKKCWAGKFCPGICPYDLEFTSKATQEFLCNIYQREVEIAIWLSNRIGRASK